LKLRMLITLIYAFPVLVLLAFVEPAEGKVYASRKQAISEAFPTATRVTDQTVYLNDGQLERIQRLAKARLDSRILRLYTGFVDERVIGYALIDVHTVRTLPEAFLLVISPTGQISRLRLLAFYEPTDYLPHVVWLRQFQDRFLDSDLSLNQKIHGIVGSTLTSQAVTSSVRRALAMYHVLLEKKTAANSLLSDKD